MAILVLAVTSGCGDAEEPGPAYANVAAGVEFVGDATCATCHEDLYASYQGHGMARSFYRWSAEDSTEASTSEPVIHAGSGLRYRVVRDDDGLYQEETIRSEEGAVVHQLLRRVDYVMGSGNAARTYFTEENGRLFQLPLTWYTQAREGRGRWDFSPGYETTNGRFDRLVPDRCMACHNSYPETIAGLEGKYTSLPEGIGCERCHGPGELHVEARLVQEDAPGEIDTTIVNPKHLSFDLRLDVCQQCHLHTTVGVLRDGATAFSYRPSQLIASHLALFADPDEGAGVPVVSHADRMKSSDCFLASRRTDRALECTTCHNPHEGFRDRGPAYFNDTCQTCHDPEPLQAAMPTAALRSDHAPDANCFACHMPKVKAEDAPHASFTDHKIRVVRAGDEEERGDLAYEPAEGNLLAPYFERDAGTADGRTYEGMATVVLGTQRGEPRTIALGAALLDQMIHYDPVPAAAGGEAQFMLGIAHQRLGNIERAVEPLEEAARADPDNPQRLLALAEAFEAAGRPAASTEGLYRRALNLQPANAQIRTGYGLFLQRQGRRDEALDTYRTARAERPSYSDAALYEGVVLTELGRRDEARTAFAEAVRLDPAHADVLANLFVLQGEGVERVSPHVLTRLLDAATHTEAEGKAVRFTTVPAGATVKVFSLTGAPVRTLQRRGTEPLRWDLRSDAGQTIGSGVYLVHVRAPGPAGTLGQTRLFRVALAVAGD